MTHGQYDPALHEQRIIAQLPATQEELRSWPPQPPVYPPPERHRGRSWPARHKVLATFGSMIAIGVIAAAAASRPSKPPAPAPVPAAAVATGSDCASQATSWYSGSAGQLINTFSSDLGTFSTAGENFITDLQAGYPTASDVSAVRSAASAIQSDARNLEADPGPSCVPGLDPAIAAAARDYSEAAADVDNGMQQFSSGSMNSATADVEAATTAMNNGNQQIATATTAVTSLSTG